MGVFIALFRPVAVIILIVYVHLKLREGRRIFEARATFAGQSAVQDMMSIGKRRSLEYVMFENEIEMDEADPGEDITWIMNKTGMSAAPDEYRGRQGTG